MYRPFDRAYPRTGFSEHWGISNLVGGNATGRLSADCGDVCPGGGLRGVSLVVSRMVSPSNPTPEKLAPYECGILPEVEPVQRFPVKFYLVAMLFVIFDVEIIFLSPGRSFPPTRLVRHRRSGNLHVLRSRDARLRLEAGSAGLVRPPPGPLPDLGRSRPPDGSVARLLPTSS